MTLYAQHDQSTMQAAVYHRYGDPEVVQAEEMPQPEPAANQVRIRVRSAAVTTGLRNPAERAKDLVLLAGLVDQGVLRPVVDRTCRLPGIAEAHRYVETGHKHGSVVIDLDSAPP